VLLAEVYDHLALLHGCTLVVHVRFSSKGFSSKVASQIRAVPLWIWAGLPLSISPLLLVTLEILLTAAANYYLEERPSSVLLSKCRLLT
jgi:hypothetical protein